MTVEEIIRIVKANVDKSVILKFGSGGIMAGVILTVDREGFVYDPDPPHPKAGSETFCPTQGLVCGVTSLECVELASGRQSLD